MTTDPRDAPAETAKPGLAPGAIPDDPVSGKRPCALPGGGDPRPLPRETVSLADALGRVLATTSPRPSTCRPSTGPSSTALPCAPPIPRARARPTAPSALNREILSLRRSADLAGRPRHATPIATGGVLPRGADAVVMVEQTEFRPDAVAIDVAVRPAPGQFVGYAGADMARARRCCAPACRHRPRDRHAGRLRSRRDRGRAPTPRRGSLDRRRTGGAGPRRCRPGAIYDSNGAIVAASVTENGGDRVRRRHRSATTRPR